MAQARPLDWKRPDYTEVYRERAERLKQLRAGGQPAWDRAITYYRSNPIDWIEDWCFTSDPRLLGLGKNPSVPFTLFPRQQQVIAWLHDRFENQESGIVEKSRDMGMSWLTVVFGVWAWLFHSGSCIGYGSYHKNKVDMLGNMDSLFEKARHVIRTLPPELRPIGFVEDRHSNYCRIVNPETGATLTGEVGNNCGRGGRSTMYFIDEFAFFEHAERADASLSQNTPCRIYASTVCGMGNLFARKRHSGGYRVFVLDWHEDPRKDAAWYAKQLKEFDPVTIAQEIDRDYHASQERTIVAGKWVRAAQAIGHVVGKWPEYGAGIGGFDIGAGGSGKSVLSCRFGPFVDPAEEWAEADTINVAALGYDAATAAGVKTLNFDNIGIGAGVAAAMRRFQDDNPDGPHVAGINVGIPPTHRYWPDGKRASEKFANFKAELWWTMRDRFQKTWEHWRLLNGDITGKEYPLDELIVIHPQDYELASQLSLPTWEPTATMKIQVESKKSLARRGIKSPDHAEALSLTFAMPSRFETPDLKGMY